MPGPLYGASKKTIRRVRHTAAKHPSLSGPQAISKVRRSGGLTLRPPVRASSFVNVKPRGSHGQGIPINTTKQGARQIRQQNQAARTRVIRRLESQAPAQFSGLSRSAKDLTAKDILAGRRLAAMEHHDSGGGGIFHTIGHAASSAASNV